MDVMKWFYQVRWFDNNDKMLIGDYSNVSLFNYTEP